MVSENHQESLILEILGCMKIPSKEFSAQKIAKFKEQFSCFKI